MYALDLFCGAGGVGLALRQSGYRVVGIDRDPDAVEIYRAAVGDAICADVRAVSPADFDSPDLVWASPPCPPWSEARRAMKMLWGLEHPDGDLLLAAARWIKTLQPKVGVIENVGGIPDDAIHLIASELESDYQITVHRLNAKWWVPQDRDHVFIIAAPELIPVPAAPGRAPKFADIEDGVDAKPVCVQHLRYAFRKRAFSTPVVGPDDVLPTVTTRPYDSRWTCFVVPSPGAIRFPTFREAARAQGFPDDHPLHNLAEQKPSIAWRLLGNAVPVPLATAVIRAIQSVQKDETSSGKHRPLDGTRR